VGVVFNLGYRNHREGRSEMRPLAEQILAAHADAEVFSFRPDRPVRHAPTTLSIYLNRVVKNVGDPAELARHRRGRACSWSGSGTSAGDDPVGVRALPRAPAAPGGFFFAATPCRRHDLVRVSPRRPPPPAGGAAARDGAGGRFALTSGGPARRTPATTRVSPATGAAARAAHGRARPSRPALLFAGFFAASLPQIDRLPFYNSIENIVVETALETRRGGHWLVPRMVDQPRVRKPPLAAWATAAAVRPATVAALSNAGDREAAYVALARQARLPALLAACLTLVATFELGRVLGGNVATGVAAGVIAGTSLLFLEHARLATPDTYLMLFVTAGNVMLARALFRGQRWLGCCAAGRAWDWP
jgi:hypothetical protein